METAQQHLQHPAESLAHTAKNNEHMTKICLDIKTSKIYLFCPKVKTRKETMPRPPKLRFISNYPVVHTFTPEGKPSGEINLPMEGIEAIRLSDFEGLDQSTAAQMMKVSRQTYGRILAEARGIVADALITGKRLRIGGGTYKFRSRHRHGRCNKGSR